MSKFDWQTEEDWEELTTPPEEPQSPRPRYVHWLLGLITLLGLTTYFIYLTAVALLVVTPGPTMLMSMNDGLRKPLPPSSKMSSPVLTCSKRPTTMAIQNWSIRC